MAKQVVTVMVVDDHPITRQGVAAILSRQPGISVVGEADDGQKALDMARSLRPSVILMDVHMPGLDGIEAIEQIKADIPDTRIIIFTSLDTEQSISRGVVAGADGYLLKDASPERLTEAIFTADRGESPIEPKIATSLLARLSEIAKEHHGRTLLSQRERRVLQLLGQGYTNEQISGELFLTENTVKSHLRKIYQKMGVRGRTEAVLEASRRGYIRL
ncbi:MAG: response regulator transcription factor [Dehalococcoidia bacterium]